MFPTEKHSGDQFKSINSSTILVSNSDATLYHDLIDGAMEYSNDTDFEDILSFFADHLDNIKGKSIEDVHVYLAD